MGNCVSSQSQAGALEKQVAGSRGRGLVAMRKAAMEKYPVPNKSRVTPCTGDGTTVVGGVVGPSPEGTNEVVQVRSRLRPPSVSSRPLSIQLSNKPITSGQTGQIDSNGNIPRPSSLPRLLVNRPEANVAAKIESLLGSSKTSGCPSQPKSQIIVNPPPSISTGSTGSSSSPSPSSRSVASSLDSSRSTSVADSGIVTSYSSRSPSSLSSEQRTSLPVNKFGFQLKRPSGTLPNNSRPATASSLERTNNANNKAAVKESAVSVNKSRPSSLRMPSTAVKVTSRIQQQQPRPSSAAVPPLATIRNRAAQVLNRRTVETRPVPELRPKLSVEAIVASLEQEIRTQFGPDPPPLEVPKAKDEAASTIDVERFLNEPAKAEITFLESSSSGGGDDRGEEEEEEEEDFIEDIEIHLQTSSSSASQPSPREQEDGSRSRDEGHPCDEEDSAATSISDDAMIDDEIADQPGLVMLGQSASVPASPMRSWRSEVFQHVDLFAQQQQLQQHHNYQSSEEEPASESTTTTSSRRRVRRRVASVSDIDGSLRREAAGVTRETMRAEIFGSKSWTTTATGSGATVVIDLEEYATMAGELADIKAQLVALQNLLMEADGASMDGSKNGTAAPLWDLKRDLVLLREELQEKNTTIRTLKNELKAVGGRTFPPSRILNSKHSSIQAGKPGCCNVATQTDRARTTLSNGASPTDNEEGHLLVSTKIKMPTPSGLPVRSSAKQQPVRLTTTSTTTAK